MSRIAALPGLARATGVAALVGVLAALPIILTLALGPLLSQLLPIGRVDLPRALAAILSLAAVLPCPPWEIFWGLLGAPGDDALFLRAAFTALALNAAIYVPMGPLFFATRAIRTWPRRSVRVAGCMTILALGHVLMLRGF